MRKKLVCSCMVCTFALLLLCILSLGISSFFIPQSVAVFEGDDLPAYPCFSLVETESAEEDSDGASTFSVRLFGVVPVKEIEVKKYEKLSLVPGGFVFGVKILSDGVTVEGFSDVPEGGVRTSPARDAGMKAGDVILSINGVPILSAQDVTREVEAADGSPMCIVCRRGEEKLTFEVTPKKSDTDGKYKTGIWVRDTSSGIGTVTFLDPVTGAFGGLGHGICDTDTGDLISFRRGSVTGVRINGITPGVSGTPGEIRGTLQSEKCGSLISNTACGVFGVLQKVPQNLPDAIPIALSNEVKCGAAKVLCTLDGTAPKEYDVEITAIHHTDGTKCFTVKVVDERLLAVTGGIVQGMSGSPIIQNGKLIGAVTHVLINDPTSGYGIFIENMLDSMPDTLK